jgi:DnaJ homolog subfamily C member 28
MASFSKQRTNREIDVMSKEKDPEQNDPIDNKKLAEHRLRMRFGWDDLIEDLIQDGQDRGAFENLRGKGKPLDLKRSHFGAEWAMAHSIMKENKVLPPWIEKRNQIVAEIDFLRIEIGRFWARYDRAFSLAQGKSVRDALALEWEKVCQEWEEKLLGINKRIIDFNLARPTDNLEIYRLRLDDELLRVGARRDLRPGA